jgi:hypothetical protein
VISSLDGVAKSGDASKVAAANLLLARAKSGLGEIAAADAADVERQFVASTTVTRALVDQWNGQHATAASLGRYDPSKDLADLDKAMAEKRAEISKLTGDKAKQDQAVGAIRAQADASRADARAQRDREAGIRASAAGKSQTVKEEIITRAAEASRAADALEKKAAELTAEADKEAPESAEIASQIERLEAQVDSLKKASENITQRAAAAREQSKNAAKEAESVGPAIAASLNALSGLRENAGKPAKDAVQRYSEASGLAGKVGGAGAAREAKAAAGTLLAVSQQSIGDVLSMRVRSLGVYATVLAAAEAATPALPNKADVSKRAAETKAELESVRAEAEAAYEKAKSAYGGAGGGPELQAKLKAVTDALEKLKAERNKPLEAAKPAAPKGEAPEAKPEDAKPMEDGEAKPEAAADVSAEVREAVETAVRETLTKAAEGVAAGNIGAFRDIVDLQNDAEKSMFDTTMPLALSFKKFDDACVAKYTKNFKTLLAETQATTVKSNPMFQMLAPQLEEAGNQAKAMSPENVAKAKITVVSATKADVSIPGDDETKHFAKTGDAWKIVLSEQERSMAAMAGAMAPMVKGMVSALDEVSGEISAGKYAAADDMLEALATRLMAAMNPGGGRPRPPGGGGTGPKTSPPGGG